MLNRLSLVASQPDYALFVAECEGEVAGLIGLRIFDPIHKVARIGEINALVVSASHKRRGIGRRLMDHAEQWMRARGITDLRLSSNNSRREEAHRFYLALGYRPTHTDVSQVALATTTQ